MSVVFSTLELIELRRQRALESLSADRQTELGQFFTPSPTAVLMASMPKIPESGEIRILDPGAGSGSLAAALVARIAQISPRVSVNLAVVEIDENLLKPLNETLDDCSSIADAVGMKLNSKLIHGDFIEMGANLGGDFDLVIMNPPYQKLGTNTWQRKKMSELDVDSPNLYAAFMALGIMNLKFGGQIVSITPRSFANGTYFERFRKYMLKNITLDRIHLFDSRSTVFSDSGVLQENIILAGTKSLETHPVIVSSSVGSNLEILSHTVDYSEIIHKADPRKFIRIPSSRGASLVVKTMSALPSSLSDLGVQVSTGRVVDFRSRDNLSYDPSVNSFPLVYPSNIKNGGVQHPLTAGKPQWFSTISQKDNNLLVPSGIYILIKRFSSKEERRRIVAGIWSPEINGSTQAAFDNKLNYIHLNGAGLDQNLAIGLSIWLNSTIVDEYFRTFSGHTQVNASDLRAMPFPDATNLRAMAHGRGYDLPTQQEIDHMVIELLNGYVVAA